MRKLILLLAFLFLYQNAFAQVKISDLPAASSVGATDVGPIVQGGVTKKATAAQVVSGGLPTQTGNANKFLMTDGSVDVWALIGLTTSVTGILPVANGGTNSSTTLNNNRIMKSSGGSIIEAAAITASRALISDSNGIPTQATTTATEIGFVNGVTSAIQTQLNAKQATGNYITALTGDVTASGPGSAAATIANSAVTNAKIANTTIDLTAKVTGALPIANGGTGQTTAANAINALLPSQTSQSGKFLTTNGSVASWGTTSGAPGGSNTDIQFNNSGSFGGDDTITREAAGKILLNNTTAGIDITDNFGTGYFKSVANGDYQLHSPDILRVSNPTSTMVFDSSYGGGVSLNGGNATDPYSAFSIFSNGTTITQLFSLDNDATNSLNYFQLRASNYIGGYNTVSQVSNFGHWLIGQSVSDTSQVNVQAQAMTIAPVQGVPNVSFDLSGGGYSWSSDPVSMTYQVYPSFTTSIGEIFAGSSPTATLSGSFQPTSVGDSYGGGSPSPPGFLGDGSTFTFRLYPVYSDGSGGLKSPDYIPITPGALPNDGLYYSLSISWIAPERDAQLTGYYLYQDDSVVPWLSLGKVTSVVTDGVGFSSSGPTINPLSYNVSIDWPASPSSVAQNYRVLNTTNVTHKNITPPTHAATDDNDWDGNNDLGPTSLTPLAFDYTGGGRLDSYGFKPQYYEDTGEGSYQFLDNTSTMLFYMASPYSTLTIATPNNPYDGQVIIFSAAQDIATLTFNATQGNFAINNTGTYSFAYSAAAPVTRFIWSAQSQRWFNY